MFTGALNHQTTHHLFPGVIQSHYPKITPIVEQTCKEFGITYHYVDTTKEALGCHIEHLRKLGRIALEGEEEVDNGREKTTVSGDTKKDQWRIKYSKCFVYYHHLVGKALLLEVTYSVIIIVLFVCLFVVFISALY